ncbi:MAG: tetratricopeptide repeat protein [Bacteroidetes bacterium]|jgi:tetratricopeptide (TPR) repeat protein|nr:tetratricopeptide repeat protein [Bacteroidota bacterium]|tara:strand:- start:37 stop:651 length:615 start_codon:yes stop_codon:yes gene_type:complete
MRSNKGAIATVVLGAALIAFVLWMPRQPESAVTIDAVVATEEGMESSDPVSVAVEKVSGANPMEGILELRALAEQDEPEVDAVVWLGVFGVQSGQFDKARERFSQALTLEPGHVEATWQLAMLDMEEGAYDRAVVGFEACMDADDSYSNGLFFTARCYEFMGKTEAAVIRYQQYLPYAPDTIISARVLDFITRLESGDLSGTNE